MMDRTKAILVFLRVSTQAQEIDEQKAEMRTFCMQNGYSEEEIIYVEGKGASAIGINDLYLQMYEQVKRHIEAGAISAVAVWAVNRLARDEEFFVRFKKLFIENKVQFLVKNPTLALLNPDGSVNAGNELALSLFSTMAKQEMEERKAKFRRTKMAYARQGKWSGGKTMKFGYRLDENHFFVEDENDAAIVRLIFDLYSTGSYSANTLSDELNDRGLRRSDALPINPPFVTRVLSSPSYYGAADPRNNDRVYPALISEDLFLRCREVAQMNRLEMRRGERLVLSAKLLKCAECGASCTSNSRHLSCCRAVGRRGKCRNKLMIRQAAADAILWRVAAMAHRDYVHELTQERLADYRAELDVLEQKIQTLEGRMARYDEKKRRIVNTYIEGYIDARERDARLAKVNAELLSRAEDLNSYKEGRSAILRLMEGAAADLDDGGTPGLSFGTGLGAGLGFGPGLETGVDSGLGSGISPQQMYDIIHRHIRKVIPVRMSFGRRDPRTRRDNGVLFNIYMASGAHLRYLFIPNLYRGHNLYIWNGRRWKADMLELP